MRQNYKVILYNLTACSIIELWEMTSRQEMPKKGTKMHVYMWSALEFIQLQLKQSYNALIFLNFPFISLENNTFLVHMSTVFKYTLETPGAAIALSWLGTDRLAKQTSFTSLWSFWLASSDFVTSLLAAASCSSISPTWRDTTKGYEMTQTELMYVRVSCHRASCK